MLHMSTTIAIGHLWNVVMYTQMMMIINKNYLFGGANMLGRAKCKILKEIRQTIADENDIPYVTRECTYQGDCSGTCPKCESELRYLEQELEILKAD